MTLFNHFNATLLVNLYYLVLAVKNCKILLHQNISAHTPLFSATRTFISQRRCQSSHW